MSKDKIVLPADGSVEAAIARVHKENSDVEWVVIGYSSQCELKVISEGAGNLENIKQHLPEKEERYALLRYKHTIDKSVTTKFVYVDWTPEGLSPMRKALLSTHKGQVTKLFEPHHVALSASEASEVDENVVLKKIGAASGTASHVVESSVHEEKKVAVAAKSPQQEKKQQVAQAGKLDYVDEGAFKDNLKELRKENGANWFLARYAKKATLEYVSTGTGGISEFANALEDGVNFGLLRVTDKVDMSVTTKFVLVRQIPDKTAPMKKAEINVLSGSIEDAFRPFHIDLIIADKSEVTEQSIMDKVTAASGTKSHVVGKK